MVSEEETANSCRNSWINSYSLAFCLISLARLSCCLHAPFFFASRQGFPFNFLLAKHSTLKFISLFKVFIVFIFF